MVVSEDQMDHFYRGVFRESTWHRKEELRAMSSVDDMIAEGYRVGAWPTAIEYERVLTGSGLDAPGRALVASYASPHPRRALAIVGDRYHNMKPDEWIVLLRAAEAAGARPSGAFALRGGVQVLATFEIGTTNGITNYMNLMDFFDGSHQGMGGLTAVRTVCANTVASWIGKDGGGIAKLRHTASLEAKIAIMAEAIGNAIASGEKLRDTYHKAEATTLPAQDARALFDRLFPPASAETQTAADKGDKSAKALVTKHENVRADARRAAALPINRVGGKGNLATLWNAATWLVDRDFDKNGSVIARDLRGEADAIESMLIGSRAKRVREVQTLIEVVMADGKVQTMTASAALAAGVDPSLTGRAILQDLLDNPN